MEATQKTARRKMREVREIERLEKERSRPKGHGYAYYLLLILCVVYITDEIATAIGGQMQSVIAQAIFAPVFGAEMAVARMSALTMISLLGAGLAFLYKPLSDRFGRKFFLVTNTFGMGLSLLLISLSTNIPVYLLGGFFTTFFVQHDMQVVYIIETAPAKHRGKVYSMIKAVATMGIMLIPVLRNIFISTDISGWRMVYMIPAIVGMIVSGLALMFARETDAFIMARLAYLRMSDEERAAAKKGKSERASQGGLISGIKFCFRHKQLRWILLSGAFVMWGMMLTSYYETTMTYGYASKFLSQGMALEEAKQRALPFVTSALFLFPVGSALLQFVQGFISDKWGRKAAAVILSASALCSFLLFFFGANNNWAPYLVGFLSGAAVGSFWGAMDACSVITTESTPTNLRTSVLTVTPMISGVLYGFVMNLALILINAYGDAYVGIISVAIAAPGLFIGLMILIFKVKETRGTDINTVGE
ncbi:MAG TPA: MFS transporter [Clostridiales bacterium]|nr:MFS transporter [Clostridiales bacterium]